MGWNITLPDAEWYDHDDPRIESLVNEVLDQDVVAIDTETTGLTVWKDMPLFWSLAWGPHKRLCMPARTLPFFRQAFDDPNRRWVFANAKFDMHMLANAGIQIAGDCVDTAVMHALLKEEESHALKDMAQKVLGWRWTDFFDTFQPRMLPDSSKAPKKLKSGALSVPTRRESIQEMLLRCAHENLPLLVDYASNDAYGTLRIYETLLRELRETNVFGLYPEWIPTMEHLFFETEVPFTKVLWNCERRGVYVDREYLQALRTPIWDEHERLLKEMARVTGKFDFNPNSYEDKHWYFIETLGLRPITYTKGGKSGVKKPSLDKGFFEYYASTVPMAGIIARDSKLTKLVSTYIDGADEHFDPNGRIHTRFNQDIARTGRLSSSGPNLQNIPRPDNDKFALRGAFQAHKGAGTSLIVGDYEQLEMRLLAAATVTDVNPEGAKDMIQLFLDGKDIHMGNAVMVFAPLIKNAEGWDLTYEFMKEAKKIEGEVKNGKRPASDLTGQHRTALEKRSHIKSISFGLNYGMKEGKLSRELGITREEAVDIINAYLNTYPAVSDFYESSVAETRSNSYSFTILGRRRTHPAIHSPNLSDRWQEERKATNNQIQGSAADAVRLAMLRIDRAGLEYKYGCKMLLQIHDELMFECPDETAAEAKAEIQELMEHPFPQDLKVPLTVSLGIGKAWNTAK